MTNVGNTLENRCLAGDFLLGVLRSVLARTEYDLVTLFTSWTSAQTASDGFPAGRAALGARAAPDTHDQSGQHT